MTNKPDDCMREAFKEAMAKKGEDLNFHLKIIYDESKLNHLFEAFQAGWQARIFVLWAGLDSNQHCCASTIWNPCGRNITPPQHHHYINTYQGCQALIDRNQNSIFHRLGSGGGFAGIPLRRISLSLSTADSMHFSQIVNPVSV